jgi:DNA-binding transcriptional regulator of glucitol operon
VSTDGAVRRSDKSAIRPRYEGDLSETPQGRTRAGTRRTGGYAQDVRRFFRPGWLGLHLIAIVLIGVFMLAGWWQLARAQGGNLQSWAYVIEWPMFAIFVVAMWVRMVRDELRGETNADPGTVTPPGAAPSPEIADIDDEDDEELAAYNRRLARLNDEASRR